MLGRLVLILLQLAGGWFGSQAIIKQIGLNGNLRLAALVIIIAIVVWLIGVIGAEVLKDVARPSGSTLAAALICAAIGAAITTGCAAIITGCAAIATGCGAAMGTFTIIGMPSFASGGQVTCIWPAGVLIRNGMPGPTPAGTVTCICCIMGERC